MLNKIANSKIKKFFLILFIFLILAGLFLLYGPYHGFRDWFITTSMSTMKHQYLARFFYSDKSINECLDKNKVIEIPEDVDTSLINFNNNYDEIKFNENSYEYQILNRSEKNNDYKIIPVKGEKYTRLFSCNL